MSLEHLKTIYASSEYIYFPKARELVSQVMKNPQIDLSDIDLNGIYSRQEQTIIKVISCALAAICHYLGMKISKTYAKSFTDATHMLKEAVRIKEEKPNKNIENPIAKITGRHESTLVNFDGLISMISKTNLQIGELFSLLKGRFPITQCEFQQNNFTITLNQRAILITGAKPWSDKEPSRLNFYEFDHKIEGIFNQKKMLLKFNSGFSFSYTDGDGPQKRPNLKNYKILKSYSFLNGNHNVISFVCEGTLASWKYCRQFQQIREDWKNSEIFFTDAPLKEAREFKFSEILQQKLKSNIGEMQ